MWIMIGIIALLLTVFLTIIIVSALVAEKENKIANCERGMNWSERKVAVSLAKALSDYPNKLIINNLILPGLYDSKHTTQIDTLVICSKGIFVIETKSWNGVIYGEADQKEWVIYYNSGQSRQVYNPTWQNDGHVNRVEGLIQKETDLDIANINIISMVIFANGDLSYVNAPDCYSIYDAVSHIPNYPDCLDEQTVNQLKELFLFYKTHASSTNEEHTKYVQQIQEGNNNDFYL